MEPHPCGIGGPTHLNHRGSRIAAIFIADRWLAARLSSLKRRERPEQAAPSAASPATETPCAT